MSCGVGHRQGSGLEFLWLWYRPVTTAPIWLLAWEPPYASGVALKKKTKQQKNKVGPEWLSGAVQVADTARIW